MDVDTVRNGSPHPFGFWAGFVLMLEWLFRLNLRRRSGGKLEWDSTRCCAFLYDNGYKFGSRRSLGLLFSFHYFYLFSPLLLSLI
jgi:hypothetical protein